MHKHAPRFNTIISDKAHRRIASVGASLFLELFKIYRADHLAYTKRSIASNISRLRKNAQYMRYESTFEKFSISVTLFLKLH
jgi:hypothetical protein